MGNNIDDLADGRTRGANSPGEEFHESFLSRYPTSQWPSFIDEIAVDVDANIGIGSTRLDAFNFAREVGPYYEEGMVAAGGAHGDIKSVLDETISERGLGTVVFELNKLRYEVEQADTGLENVQTAIEAVLEKLLTQETGVDFSTHAQTTIGTTADVVMELFSDDAVARHAETLVDEFEESVQSGLLARLDEPQMMTPLWRHQLDALRAWQDADYRGYADMATATGKTVLGLAAVALRYGHLHPIDDLAGRRDSRGKDTVLIVAHSDLILEQWRREFETHLNIPQERTQGADEIELTWGDVHFRTPQRLINQETYEYDLVILDEAHHYATASEWGSLLDSFDGDVLALSGSVDDAGTDSEALQDRLREGVGPEVKRYGIAEAQRDGVIPAFDWEVRYAPFEVDDEFVELSESIADAFAAFRERVESGDVIAERRLRTFDDVRTYTHTTEGKALKREDDQFRDLSTAVFSRRMKRWHLAPSLDAIVDVVVDHQNDHVVVLVDSNAQVEAITDLLAERVSASVEAATSDHSREALRDQLDAFDAAEDGGVLVGTGDLLGEGVDIPEANVAVNMATGGVNAQLVQRIGRVLRNPSGDKHAHFYNVVGVPAGDAAVPRQDGRRLLEDAGEFCALGGRFNNLPGFATSNDLDSIDLSRLLIDGLAAVEELVDADAYEWPTDEQEATHLRGLLDVVRETEDVTPTSVLGAWSEYSWYESRVEHEEVSANEARPLATTTVSVSTERGDPLRGASVAVETTEGQDATVLENGASEWTVTLRGAGEAVLRATHPDFDAVTRPLSVADAPKQLDLALSSRVREDHVEFVPSTLESADGALECLVTDESNEPIAGVAVTVTNPDWEAFGVTDGAGRVELDGVQATAPIGIAAHHPDGGVMTASMESPTNAAVAVLMQNG